MAESDTSSWLSDCAVDTLCAEPKAVLRASGESGDVGTPASDLYFTSDFEDLLECPEPFSYSSESNGVDDDAPLSDLSSEPLKEGGPTASPPSGPTASPPSGPTASVDAQPRVSITLCGAGKSEGIVLHNAPTAIAVGVVSASIFNFHRTSWLHEHPTTFVECHVDGAMVFRTERVAHSSRPNYNYQAMVEASPTSVVYFVLKDYRKHPWGKDAVLGSSTAVLDDLVHGLNKQVLSMTDDESSLSVATLSVELFPNSAFLMELKPALNTHFAALAVQAAIRGVLSRTDSDDSVIPRSPRWRSHDTPSFRV